MKVKHCPKCDSTNVSFPSLYRPSIWMCRNCDYEGAFIIEGDIHAEKCRSTPEIDTTSLIELKEGPILTIETVKWTNSAEL